LYKILLLIKLLFSSHREGGQQSGGRPGGSDRKLEGKHQLSAREYTGLSAEYSPDGTGSR
jgi:hypothetical protein